MVLKEYRVTVILFKKNDKKNVKRVCFLKYCLLEYKCLEANIR